MHERGRLCRHIPGILGGVIRTADIPTGAYKVGLVVTTIIWGGSFVVTKGALESISAGWLLAIRFFAAGVVSVPLFWRRLRANFDGTHVFAGAVIGISGGLAYLVQAVGLTYTTPAKNAFLTATYCAIVPFLHWAISHRRPGIHNFIAATLCIMGVFLVTMGSAGLAAFSLGVGDALTLVCAVLFALNIIAIAYLTTAHDVATLTVIQLFVFSAICAMWALLSHEPAPDVSLLTPHFLVVIAYLVLIGTVFTLILQNVGQKYVEPSQASLFMSFESVFGTIFSVIFYHEQLSLPMLVGFVAIFASVLVSELVGTYNGQRTGASEARE